MFYGCFKAVHVCCTFFFLFLRVFYVSFGGQFKAILKDGYLSLTIRDIISEYCFLGPATPCKKIVIFRDYSATRNF